MQRPALSDDRDHAEHIFRRFGIIIGLSQKLRLERRIEQFCLLLFPRQVFDGLPAGPEGEGVHRTLPRHNDPIAAQGDLRDDVCAIVILRAHIVDLLVQRQFLGDGLERSESDGNTRLAAKFAHPFKLVPVAVEVARHFENSVAAALLSAAHRMTDRDQFFRCGRGSGHKLTVNRFVQDGA